MSPSQEERHDGQREWLEVDGRGGFASGTVDGIRTRRYHALLLVASTPPTGRIVLVNGFEAWIETPGGRFALSSQRYGGGVIHPDGWRRMMQFTSDPWPTWTFRCEDGTEVIQEIFIARDTGETVLTWRLGQGNGAARLFVRPLLSGRDYHNLHRENPEFRFEAEQGPGGVLWRPYPGVPGIVARSSARGLYRHEPLWYRNFEYAEERARGLDDREELASPGVFEWDLSSADAVWTLAASHDDGIALSMEESVEDRRNRLAGDERRRRTACPSRLHRAAEAYIVEGRHGRTVIAGYPWFADWGRDTFIALRGLCLATGRHEVARDILLSWAGHVSEGMLPNRFPDRGQQPEYNSVDASLWFVIAVHELLQATSGGGAVVSARQEQVLQEAVQAILEGYSRGTRFGIRATEDGLLACGAPGVQLTWMDAKVGDWVVTPRVGKPVEIQALWLNALAMAGRFSERWAKVFERGLQSFRSRFWNESRGCLFDVVDVDHREGGNDPALRPNQVFAVGGLPIPLVEGERARSILKMVEAELLTPMGLRSLGPGDAGYSPRYVGGVLSRDGAYHQGTVWPWLMGAFVEGWMRVQGDSPEARRQARVRFLDPLLAHLDEAGVGHVSEIADAEAPHTPRGCPWQAWSVGELLRLERILSTHGADGMGPLEVAFGGKARGVVVRRKTRTVRATRNTGPARNDRRGLVGQSHRTLLRA